MESQEQPPLLNPYQVTSAVVEAPPADQGPFNPWLSIWFAPRRTIRRICVESPTKHVLLLSALSGITQVFDNASFRSIGDQLPLVTIVGMALIAGPIAGLIGLFIGSAVIGTVGRLLGGNATAGELRAAMSWAAVPSVMTLLLLVPQIALIGNEVFSTDTPILDENVGIAMAFGMLGVAELIIAIWGFFTYCNTVAEVQGFSSAWMGFLNLLLALMIVVVLVVGLAILVVIAVTASATIGT